MHQPEEACSPGVATRLAKRRSMDGAVPSTPPSSGKGKRRDAPSDYRADVSRALDLDAAADVPEGSSGATDEEMHDRSPRESRSVSSDDADVREDIAAVAREAAVDRKVRVLSARQTPPLSIDDGVSETKHATSRCFPSVRGTRVDEIVQGRFFFSFFRFFVFSFFREMFSSDPDASCFRTPTRKDSY